MCEFCNVDRALNDVAATRVPSGSEWFWCERRLIRVRWDVLAHPFYERWSAGELTRDELQLYAEEYDHLVVTLAVASKHAAQKASAGLLRDTLADHAAVESAHIGLWRTFACGTGWSRAHGWHYRPDPLPATVECARIWGGNSSRSLAMDLVTLYAIEGSQPEIARTKLDGLLDSYGFLDGPATEYFRVHADLDAEHAALAQAGLSGLLDSADPFALLTQACRVHRGYWNMLDAPEEASHR